MSRLSDSEVLGLLNGESVILDIAREVTETLREQEIDDAAIVGGLAVYLHGHRRVTVDVDVYTPDTKRLGNVLTASGFQFEEADRQFVKRNVPVHLVTNPEISTPPRAIEEIEGVRVVSLPDLIDMKLRSGLAKVTRAQDLADVIALIRLHKLSGEYARKISKDLQQEFCRLVAAVREGR